MKIINYIKSPVNWVGNKFKYLDTINSLIKNKQYTNIIDLFMGSGNLILNINCKANKYIGNDRTKLIPKLYTELPKYTYNLQELQQIIDKFNRFSAKEDYYTFRDYWNTKYLTDQFDKDFIYETILLLKMCSNSMIRFNQQGVFNQGFRGLGNCKEFFALSMKNLCVDGLNNLATLLQERQYKFAVKDFMSIPKQHYLNPSNLLILDPPYILRQEMYSQDFSPSHDNYLIDILKETKSDFIYFNYLIRDGELHKELDSLIKHNNFKVIDINDKTTSGQGRSQGSREVREVIITNV